MREKMSSLYSKLKCKLSLFVDMSINVNVTSLIIDLENKIPIE